MFFDVGVNPDEWTTSGNWVGDVVSIAHEAHHLLGLDDRYDYIESHAENEDLAIGDRLYWFREQMSRPYDPEGANSMMNDSSLSLLDDDVCNVAGLDVDQCVAARQAARRALIEQPVLLLVKIQPLPIKVLVSKTLLAER